MKTTLINEKRTKEVTPEGEDSIKLSIHSDGIEHLMGTLSNLYSRPAEAVFREYVSNALDSHLLAKQTRPIEVTLKPYRLNFILEVKDFGVGMNRDDITNIYSKYAASTKRDSNTQIGAFGLGAKSALAVSNRFDVVSVKDGIETVFYCEKKDGVGVPRIVFVSETKTKAPNGVTVTIPINEAHYKTMETFAQTFFKTWNPAQVIYNNESIERFENVYDVNKYRTLYAGEEVIGWVKLAEAGKTRGYHQGRFANLPEVSIAGISYKIESSHNINAYTYWNELANNKILGKSHDILQNMADWGIQVIVNLPIGSVDLTPSRESIMVTPKTAAALQAGFEALNETIYSQMLSKLNSLPIKEAFKFYAQHLPALGVEKSIYEKVGSPVLEPQNLGVSYKGNPIPTNFIVDNPTIHVISAVNATAWEETVQNTNRINLFAILNGHKGTRQTGGQLWSPNHYHRYDSVVVYGEYNETNMAIAKRNARSYALANQKSKYVTLYFINSKTKPQNEWLESLVDVVSLDTLEQVGKAYRSSMAASRKGQGTGKKRPTAIHFGAIYNASTQKVEQRKFSGEELGNHKKVIIVTQESHDVSATYTVDDMAYVNASSFWSEMGLKNIWEDENWNLGRDSVEAVTKAFPDVPIIFVPRVRSVNPIFKANNATVMFHEAWIEKVEQVKKTQSKLFDAVQSLNMTLKGKQPLFDALYNENNMSLLDSIEDTFTREVVEVVAKKREMLNLILAGRLFLKRTTRSGYYTKINMLMTNWAANRNTGWAEKFTYLNPHKVDHSQWKKHAETYVKLINSLDS